MNQAPDQLNHLPAGETSLSEFLILPGGRILAHNLSPTMAEVLRQLDPEDEAMNRRAARTCRSSQSNGAQIKKLETPHVVSYNSKQHP